MKSRQISILFYQWLGILFLGLVLSTQQASAQCGAEPITITPWCENTFAHWQFDAPTPNASYTWYNWQGPYTAADLDANGNIIKAGAIKYDSTTATDFYSTFRVRSADIAPQTAIQFAYVKRVKYKAVPYPAVAPTFTNTAANSTFSMAFTNTGTVRFNTVKVPVVLNNPGAQYKIQIMIGAVGSAVYTFSTVSATSLGGSRYLVEVPVNLTTSGNQTISVNTNPPGAGLQVDGLLYSSAQAPASTAGPVSVSATAATAGFGVIYDWDITVTCTPQTSGLSSKTTTGCCVPPTNVGLFSVTSTKSSLVNNGPVNATLTAAPVASTADFFAWYLNGVYQPGVSGVNKSFITTNKTGTWEVREGASLAAMSNPSCYSSATTIIQDKQITATIVTAPTNNPLCIGDQWTLSGTGSTDLTWSTGGGILSSTTGSTTTFTATATGSTTITLTGDITTGALIDEKFDVTTSIGQNTQMSGPQTFGTIINVNGGYAILGDLSGTGNTDWTLAGNRPAVKGQGGATDKFLVVNGSGIATAKPLVWGKMVNAVTPGKAYTFSFDFTSISYVISDNIATDGYNATPTAPYRDVVLEVFINGVSLGTANTNFAANGGLNAVGAWKNYSFPWTATSSTATVEIRQITPANENRGYDYGIDNIAFGGIGTQIDEVIVGPVTDCSSITASTSTCVQDSMATLTATLTGGLIFDHWEKTSAPGISVGTTNPITVKSINPEEYKAIGYLAAGNVLVNGNFDQGDNGFLSGGGRYYTSAGAGNAANQYSVLANTQSGNGSWSNLPQAPGQPAGSLRYIADNRGPVTANGRPIVGWTFTAAQNAKFAFSGWVANQHNNFTNATPDTTNSGRTAQIGVYINNTLIARVNTPTTQAWTQMLATWTAPLAGTQTYTLEVRDLRTLDIAGFGNDIVLDGFVLAPAVGTPKSATVTPPLCNPCLNNQATVNTATFCGNSAIVSLTPSAGDLTGVTYDWYKAATGGVSIGSTVGNQKDTFDITGVPLVAGSKTIYYTKSAKGSGTVYRQNQSCNPAFNAFDNINNGQNLPNFQTQFTATQAIRITEFDISLRSELYNTGDAQSATLNFRIVGAKPGNGGLVADASVTYGSFSKTFTRTRVAPQGQTKDTMITVTGLANVPAGVFFIINDNNVKSGSGNMSMGRGNCTQAVPVADNLNGTTVRLSGLSQNFSNNQTGGNLQAGYFFNVDFQLPAAPCPRIAVPLTESCPCTPPVLVNVNPAFDNDTTMCQGSNLTLTATITLGATPPLNGYKYTWYKKVGAGAATAIGASTNAFAPLTLTGITAADAAAYILRVEDGTAGNASCYKQDTLRVTVNLPVTAGTVSSSQVICSGTKPSADFTGTAATGGAGAGTYKYQWQSTAANGSAYSNIAGAAATGYVFPAAVFNNTTTTNQVYSYRRRDSSGVCPTVTTNVITITVLPPVLPGTIGSSQQICSGTAPLAFTQTPASGGLGAPYNYQWESSADNINFGNAAGGSGATTALYTAPTLSANTYYRRKVTSSNCAARYSDTIAITMVPALTAGTVSPATQSTCYNTIPSTALSSTAFTGGLKTAASYTYSWEYLPDGADPVTGWLATGITTFPGYAFPSALTDTTKYRLAVTGSCATVRSNEVTVLVRPELLPGSIAAGTSTTVCSGGNPDDITSTRLPFGAGGSSDWTYQWQVSVNGGAFAPVSPASNTAAYAVPVLPANNTASAVSYTFKRVVSSTLCALPKAESNAVTYTVNPVVTPGVIAGGTTTTVCSGNAADMITETTAASGGDGNFTYQWQSSPNGSTGWTDISGETGATFIPTGLTADTWFRRLDKSSTCTVQPTNTVKITVLAGITAGTISGTQIVCSGETPQPVTTATNPTGVTANAVVSWEAFDGTNWVVIPGSGSGNSLTFPSALPQTVMIRKVVKDASLPGPCNEAQTTPVTITVRQALTAGAIDGDENICGGDAAAAITETTPAAGGTGSYTYTWEKSENGGAWTVISGAVSATLSPGTLSLTTDYRRNVTSGTCGTLTSNIVTKSVTPKIAVSVGLPDPGATCSGSNVTFTASPFGEGTNPTYQWFVNGASMGAPANNPTFTSSTLSDGDKVKVTLVSSVTCKTGSPATSPEVAVVITGAVTPSVAINTPATICAGTNTTFKATPTGGGTPTYQWYLNGNAVGANQDTYSGIFTNNDQIRVEMKSSLPCATTSAFVPSPTVTMTVLNAPAPTIIEPDQAFCSGNSFTYHANTGAGTLTWYKNGTLISGANSNSLTVSESGVYTIRENNGTCDGTSPARTVVVTQTPNASAGADIYIKEGETGTLNASGGGIYEWTPSTGLSNPNIANPTFVANNTITYTVKVTEPTNTCSAFASVNVLVEKPIRIPNAITINGDGNNDTWDIENIQSFPSATFEIYNRYGTLVWKSTGYPKQWDGTNYRNGEVLPDGTYFYIIDLHSKIYTEPYTGYIEVLK